MTIAQLYDFLEKAAPRALSAEWDNDGFSCLLNPQKKVKRVLIALDATEEAVDLAVTEKFDLLLTHHPLLFRGIKALTAENCVPRKLIKLTLSNVAALSFHTRLDAAEGGVNDILAELLGLTDVHAFAPDGEVPCGRIGKLPAVTDITELARTVCALLDAPAVNVIGKGKARTIAVIGGEGGDFVDAARREGADVILSGRIGYHRMLDAVEDRIAVIEAGHFYTERPVLARLAALVKQADPAIEVKILDTPAIQTVTK